MRSYGVNELRKMFLDYFESKDHLVVPSYSLVPHNDNSLLLINAGMAPLKPYFTGAEIPPRTRMASCQKCIRTGDIDNVGHTSRHGTFFEMLGNFSFGDYFKKEAIEWTWEFLTDIVGLDPDRLYPSVYLEDDEAFGIWRDVIGIPEERIYKFGKEDNFWEHGAGPCGPCSEVYFDRGEEYGCGKEDCAPGCDCDRFMEVWNDVFTQFEGDGNGNYTPLAKKNIDTGMGLERLAVASQGVPSMFDVDTIRDLREEVCRIANKKYQEKQEDDVSIRVITDHIRSATFMISDGIVPSNEGRGYVLRRLIRRAARHGRLLGIKEDFLADLSRKVAETSCDGYPELKEKEVFILEVLAKEEEQFNRTIDQGLRILGDLEEQMKSDGTKVLDGKEAFRLYDTFGFPLDLTREILAEKGYSVDEKVFEECMKEQKKRAHDAHKESNYMGAEATVYDELPSDLTTEFTGYTNLKDSGRIEALTTESEVVDALTEGQNGTIVLDRTPFYATMGGQVGDTGTIRTKEGSFLVEETIPLRGGREGHIGRVTEGMLKIRDEAELAVDEEKRHATEKNHSATHLLQKALKIVLGDHVEQKGSYVSPDRLRFDFVHFKAMTPEEIAKVEEIVNREIRCRLEVGTKIMSLEDAKKTGAMALFGEKYGDEVRVVSMGDFSVELCGGTHVTNTSDITLFKIISENGIASGVRRIEALTGDTVLAHYQTIEEELNKVAAALKSTPMEAAEKAASLNKQVRELSSEIESLKTKAANESLGDAGSESETVNGIAVLCKKVSGVDMNGLRTLSDQLKIDLGDCVLVLASDVDGKVALLVASSEAAIEKGISSGNLIRELAPLIGGKGGGKPAMAQAGGSDPAGIDALLEKAKEVIKGIL